MNELGVQTKLIEAAKGRGGEGLKMSNRFKAGVSDLLLQLPDFPQTTIIAEVKYAPKLPVRAALMPLGLAPIQAAFLVRWQKAGASAGVLLAASDKRDYLYLAWRDTKWEPSVDEFVDQAIRVNPSNPLRRALPTILAPLLVQMSSS